MGRKRNRGTRGRRSRKRAAPAQEPQHPIGRALHFQIVDLVADCRARGITTRTALRKACPFSTPRIREAWDLEVERQLGEVEAQRAAEGQGELF